MINFFEVRYWVVAYLSIIVYRICFSMKSIQNIFNPIYWPCQFFSPRKLHWTCSWTDKTFAHSAFFSHSTDIVSIVENSFLLVKFVFPPFVHFQLFYFPLHLPLLSPNQFFPMPLLNRPQLSHFLSLYSWHRKHIKNASKNNSFSEITNDEDELERRIFNF